MHRPGDLGHLNAAQWDQLQELADRFEEAWRHTDTQGGTVTLAEFLPASGDPLRAAALEELVKTDLEMRWRRNLPVELEEYLQQHRELGNARTLPAVLIYEEYRVRQLHGDRPPLEPYRSRFPNQFAELQKLLHEQPVATVRGSVPVIKPPTASGRVSQAPSLDQQPTRMGQSARSQQASKANQPSQARQGTKAEPPAGKAPAGSILPGGGGQVLSFGGGYKLIKRIGSGSFGEVWRAEAPGGFEAAVKVLFRSVEDEEGQRELQSLELIKRLRHPFLLSTQSFEAVGERLYIIMELADSSLRDRLKESRKANLKGVPPGELLTYMRESAEALDYLHSEKVLHRDIKPENILLLKNHAKLADFGLARWQQSQRLMMSASISGTPVYMPPEVWRGKVSERSDQYSLAVTYVELRLDKLPFASRELLEIMQDHLDNKPQLDPLGPAEQEVLVKALAKDPAQRFASCSEFVEALGRALAREMARTDPDFSGPFTGDQATGARVSTRAGPSNMPPGSSADAPAYYQSLQSNLGTLPPVPAGAPQKRWQDTVPEAPTGPAAPAGQPTRRQMMLMAGTAILAGVGGAVALYRFVIAPPEKGSREEVYLPPGCQKAEDATVITLPNSGKRAYNRVLLDKDGIAVPFRLVPDRTDDNVRPFYMMETKVWNDLFGKFAHGPNVTVDPEWKQGAVANQHPLGIKDGQLPVMRVTARDADAFARWLGGQLPNSAQWEKAAGWTEGQKGRWPVEPWKLGPPQVAVNLAKEGPMPVTQSKDLSPFDCRDMAGNGREWTRTLTKPLFESGQLVDFDPKAKDVHIEVRGRPYWDQRQFDSWQSYIAGCRDSVPIDEAHPDIGFRVVLELVMDQ